jgi:peptide/nickel transport system substrate-binding protein
VGVELRPKLVKIGPQLFGAKFTSSYDIAVLPFPGPGPGGPNGDPDILRLLFDSNVHPTLEGATVYANAKFNKLAATQRTTFDVAKRMPIVHEMQKILATDLPVMSLYYPTWDVIFRKSAIPTWYFCPGQFPSPFENKQLFITGKKTGTQIRT